MAKVTSKKKPKTRVTVDHRPEITTLTGVCGTCKHGLHVNLAKPQWCEFMELQAFCKDCQLLFTLRVKGN